MGHPERTYGIRGNIFSFLLDWMDTMDQLYDKIEDGNLEEWPLSPDQVCQFVRVNLIRGQADLINKFKQLHVRSRIVKQLAHIYIDRHVQDLGNRPGILKLHRRHGVLTFERA